MAHLREKGLEGLRDEQRMTERLIRDREAAILNPESFQRRMERFLADRDAALDMEAAVDLPMGPQRARTYRTIYLELYLMVKYARKWAAINRLGDATKYKEQVLFFHDSKVFYFLAEPNRIPAGG